MSHLFWLKHFPLVTMHFSLTSAVHMLSVRYEGASLSDLSLCHNQQNASYLIYTKTCQRPDGEKVMCKGSLSISSPGHFFDILVSSIIVLPCCWYQMIIWALKSVRKPLFQCLQYIDVTLPHVGWISDLCSFVQCIHSFKLSMKTTGHLKTPVNLKRVFGWSHNALGKHANTTLPDWRQDLSAQSCRCESTTRPSCQQVFDIKSALGLLLFNGSSFKFVCLHLLCESRLFQSWSQWIWRLFQGHWLLRKNTPCHHL